MKIKQLMSRVLDDLFEGDGLWYICKGVIVARIWMFFGPIVIILIGSFVMWVWPTVNEDVWAHELEINAVFGWLWFSVPFVITWILLRLVVKNFLLAFFLFLPISFWVLQML